MHKQKALSFILMKNRALFFYNPMTGQLILLFEVQKQTKSNFKFYISKEDTSQFSFLSFRWVIASILCSHMQKAVP